MKRHILLLLALAPLALMAQSGTNSPYSQYGLGVLSDQTTGFNRGMNGVGIAMHESNQVNPANPASYASVDSLTMIFDIGAAVQLTNFKEGATQRNANNGNFEYAVMAFRAAKGLGVSVGVLPFSNIGYDYSSTRYVSETSSTTYTTNYNGTGGTRVAYVGVGWQPLPGLAVGANVGYLWGDYTRSVVNSYSDAYVNTIARYYTAEMTSYRLDAGVQYTHKLGRKDNVTIGATFSPGHSLGGSADLNEVSVNSQTNVSDTTATSYGRALFVPTTIGAGLAWYHGTKWRVGLDYTLQQWAKRDFPMLRGGKYVMVGDALNNRHKIAFGGEYVHNTLSRHYLDHVHLRAGVSYATPYIRVNGHDGPKEIAASVGFGFPIINAYNNRSMFNLSAQWVRSSAAGMIRENSFRINLGITFNERWFMKWKLE